ncbi:MAG TPA: hypothetical protein VFW23_19045, partial [Tepidisphaeraceae bacterium]|nr:hypothetical protein [Tepidisphaeraceae bacterium]
MSAIAAAQYQPADTSGQPSYFVGETINARPGDSFQAEATVSASSDYSTPLYGNILAQLNLSTDQTWYNGPGLIGQATQYVFLPSGQTTVWYVPCTIPTWVQPGTYNLVEFLDLDDTNSISGSYTQVNNVVNVSSAVLSAKFTGTIPSAANAGDSISPALQISDAAGAGNVVNGNESTYYYLSTTPDLTGLMPALAVNTYALNVNAGGSITEFQSVTIPSDTSPGTYYLVARVDPLGIVDGGRPGPVVVSGPIIIPGISASFTSGIPQRIVATGQLSPSLEMTDLGTQPLSGSETIDYYLSTNTDPSSGVLLGTTTQSIDLQPGES